MKEKLIVACMGDPDTGEYAFTSEIYGYDKEGFLLYDCMYKKFIWVPF